MRPARISGADPLPLGAPRDWNEEQHGHCAALFIRRECIDGIAYMRSSWEVESGEAALMLAGANMTLGIQGFEHPVVQLGVGQLPPDFDPVLTARRFTHVSGLPFVRVEMLFPHAGGQRGYCEVHVDGTLADAISTGVTRIEALARKEGWIE